MSKIGKPSENQFSTRSKEFQQSSTPQPPVPLSPLKMTAEKMQMVRRDVKPGNGTSLLTYQNHASLRSKLAKATCAVDARASDFYIKEKIAAPERYAHTRHREMEELRKENNRLFGRLLSIYEVSRKHLCLIDGKANSMCLFVRCVEKTTWRQRPQAWQSLRHQEQAPECQN